MFSMTCAALPCFLSCCRAVSAMCVCIAVLFLACARALKHRLVLCYNRHGVLCSRRAFLCVVVLPCMWLLCVSQCMRVHLIHVFACCRVVLPWSCFVLRIVLVHRTMLSCDIVVTCALLLLHRVLFLGVSCRVVVRCVRAECLCRVRVHCCINAVS